MPTLLAVRFSALGDVAMSVPIVNLVARQYPEVRLVVVSRPFVAPLFEGMPPNVTFVGADVKGEYAGVWGLVRLALRLRRLGITHVADLHDVLRTKFVRLCLRLCGCRVRHINKGRRERRSLLSHRLGTMCQLPTSFERYAGVFSRLGFPVALERFTPFKPAPLLSRESVASWIGIAPFAAHAGKVYPLERMAEAVASLVGRHPDSRIFVFGSKDEMHALRPAWSWPQLTFVCDVAKGLGQELRLMSQLDVMVSMDSANMHLASLVATPVVSIWGATHPFAGFLGWQQQESDAVQASLPCRPCSIFGKKPCRFNDYRCFQLVEPKQVVAAVEKHLAHV